MTTIEQSIKAQFAKIFTVADWWLFKKMAESNLLEAATLKKSDMPVEANLRLLARNSRKRLLVGVGVELLLKAIYLNQGYAINKPAEGESLRFPFFLSAVDAGRLLASSTFSLDQLIKHLPTVLELADQVLVVRGLSIAKVFRNKEGHSVTDSHQFDASNYHDIAAALTAIYRDAFGETLSVRFSIAPNERPIWRLSSANV